MWEAPCGVRAAETESRRPGEQSPNFPGLMGARYMCVPHRAGVYSMWHAHVGFWLCSCTGGSSGAVGGMGGGKGLLKAPGKIEILAGKINYPLIGPPTKRQVPGANCAPWMNTPRPPNLEAVTAAAVSRELGAKYFTQ